MSDDTDFEYAREFREAQRSPTNDRHAELARRKQRREAAADRVQEQRAERRAAQDREDAKWCRPLTAADISVYDRFHKVMDDTNAETARGIRRHDRLDAKLDRLMREDYDEYMTNYADGHARLKGIRHGRYKGE